ncbi:unnamed protein product, partial [Leptidea sinapis]
MSGVRAKRRADAPGAVAHCRAALRRYSACAAAWRGRVRLGSLPPPPRARVSPARACCTACSLV